LRVFFGNGNCQNLWFWANTHGHIFNIGL
jgi:hypothetical protein